MPKPRIKHRTFDLARIGESGWLAGVDEAGRGCLAGPVVAGAVLVERRFYDGPWCARMARCVDDSKKLSPEERAEVFDELKTLIPEGDACFAPGMADAREIEQLNILGATKLAMRRALAEVGRMAPSGVRLPEKSASDGLFATAATTATALVIVDGLPLKNFPYEHAAYVGGDGRSLVIGLASIVAKVTRDRLMESLDARYPQYGFARHKGYGTPQHREALLKYGPCELHRASFLVKMMGDKPDEGGEQPELPFS